MAVGGVDRLDKAIKQVELFDPREKAWSIDAKRALPFLIKKYI